MSIELHPRKLKLHCPGWVDKKGKEKKQEEEEIDFLTLVKVGSSVTNHAFKQVSREFQVRSTHEILPIWYNRCGQFFIPTLFC